MKILFMCVANSARSQLAEGLARHMLPDCEIQSAGSQPGKLNPYAVAVLKEVGLDISMHYSKSIDDLPHQFVASLDYIITLCAEEVCPMVIAPSAKRLHWGFPDPATKEELSEAEMLTRFRAARDGIKAKLEQLKQELSP